MQSLSKCKICGYIMETDKIPELCPACGLPKKVFEPYTPTLSESRYKFLSYHIHPIILHFPQAFVLTAFGLLILAMFFTGTLKDQTMIVIKFNLIFLPLLVVLGALTGMKDGQVRFKKITTPVLKFKIIMSCVFLGLSIVDAVLVLVLTPTLPTLILLAFITLLATGSAVLLGKAGGQLMESYIPGKEKAKITK